MQINCTDINARRANAGRTGKKDDATLVQLISQRAGRCLERRGLLEQDAENAWLDLEPADDTDALPHIMGSSISYRVAVGPQQGQKAFMIRTVRPLDRTQLHRQSGLHPEDTVPGWH